MHPGATQERGAEEFFQAISDAFDLAAAAGCERRSLSLAGKRVDLVVAAGTEAAACDGFLSALAARPVEREIRPNEEALTVLVWSQQGTGVSLPAPNWQAGDYAKRGEIARLSTARLRTAYNIQSRTLCAIDLELSVAVQCVHSFAGLPQHEWGAPLRDIVSWWLTRQGIQVVHASAICAFGKGALLAGPGNSGKSTTAAQCLGHDLLSFIADDYCAVSQGRDLRIHALFRTSKQCVPAVQAVAGLDGGEWSEETGKILYRIDASAVADDVALHSILLPEITDAKRSEIIPVGKGHAIRRMAPSTLFQLPCSGRQDLALMSALVRRVPTYRLRLGRHREHLLATLAEHLRGVA